MHVTQRQEQFSRAFVQAVASPAGFHCSTPPVDDDSIDLSLAARGGGGTVRAPRLEMQVKCTTTPHYVGSALHFPLPLKNYNDLRHTDVLVPRILVVVVTDPAPTRWIEIAPPDSTIRECGYWASLRGQPATSNAVSVTVALPLANEFTPMALANIMNDIANGVAP